MGWASDSILVRYGLRKSNIFAAMFVSYAVSVTCMWTYLIATTSLEFLKSPAMIYYVISGCIQPLFARALFPGHHPHRSRPRRTTARIAAVRRAVAVVFDERPAWLVYIG